MTPLLSSVLIVDDEPAVRDLMARWVGGLGLQAHTASNADEAMRTLHERHADLAVIDVMMPGKNGLWLAGEVRREHPHTAVVLATAYTEVFDGTPPPVADLLVKPFRRDRFMLAVDRGRQWRQEALAEVEWHAKLTRQLSDAIAAICAELLAVSGRGGDESARLMALAVERDPALVAHGARVARDAVAVGRQLQVSAAEVREIEMAARFHDIGKIAIPASLVDKPSPLTPGELAIMRRHVDAGADLLAATPSLAAIAPLVRASHEWFGGGGYPARLAGAAIPLPSRIIAVVDAYDAMTQDRSYRRRLDSSESISELLRCAPAQFDPEVVIAFLTTLSRD
jgi:response regulator RpfG family c-di-GMP phosphodiesterase